jgi:putative transposase
MKRRGQPKVIVTDRFRSYRAAMNVIGNGADQECGRGRRDHTNHFESRVINQ